MKTLLGFCISLLLLASGSIPAFSEEVKKQDDSTSKVALPVQYVGLGVSAGAISGLGFSYREYLSEKIGYKIATVLYNDKDNSFFDAGLQGIYVLSDSDNGWLRFYAIAGVSDFYYKRTNHVYDPVPAPTPTEQNKADLVPTKEIVPRDVIETNNYVNFGAGLGLEIGRNKKNLSLSLELPLVIGVKNFSKIDYTYPIPQISLIYNF